MTKATTVRILGVLTLMIIGVVAFWTPLKAAIVQFTGSVSVPASGSLTTASGAPVTFGSAPSSANGYTAGSSTYGATSTSVNGPLNSDNGNSSGLGLQISGKNVVYSNGGGANNDLYLGAPLSTGGSIFFGHVGAGTAYGNISGAGYSIGSSTYGPTSATVNGPISGNTMSLLGNVSQASDMLDITASGGATGGLFSVGATGGIVANDMLYDVRNYGWTSNPSTALTNALAAASAAGGGCVFIPPTTSSPTLTGDFTVPTGVSLCGKGFPSEFVLNGKLTFATDSGTDGVSLVVGANAGNCADYGVQYSNQSFFRNTRFATIGCSNYPLVSPSSHGRIFDSFIGDYFEVEGSSLTGITLLQTFGSYTVVDNNTCFDTHSGNSTKCFDIEGTATYPSSNVSIVGNVAYGAGVTVGDTLTAAAAGNLTKVTYSANAMTAAPTLTNVDSTTMVVGNTPSGSNSYVAGSSTYGPTGATVNGFLTYPSAGTATASQNYSNVGGITFNGSNWDPATTASAQPVSESLNFNPGDSSTGGIQVTGGSTNLKSGFNPVEFSLVGRRPSLNFDSTLQTTGHWSIIEGDSDGFTPGNLTFYDRTNTCQCFTVTPTGATVNGSLEVTNGIYYQTTYDRLSIGDDGSAGMNLFIEGGNANWTGSANSINITGYNGSVLPSFVSNATTSTFNGSVDSGNALSIGNNKVYANTTCPGNICIFMPNQAGGTDQTWFGVSNTANVSGGITCSVWCAAAGGIIWTVSQDASGNMGIAGQFYAGSSIKLKHYVRPLQFDPLKIIADTDWVQFCYKSDKKCHANSAQTQDVGFIAERTSGILAGKKHDSMSLNKTVGIEGAAIKELSQRVSRISRHQQGNGSDNPLRLAVAGLILWNLILTVVVVMLVKRRA